MILRVKNSFFSQPLTYNNFACVQPCAMVSAVCAYGRPLACQEWLWAMLCMDSGFTCMVVQLAAAGCSLIFYYN